MPVPPVRLLAAGVLLAASPASAAAQETSAPVSALRYELTFTAETAARRALAMEVTFAVAGTAPVLLSLPVWTPGAYEVSNFARNVLGFRARQGPRELDWDKLDYDTWRVRPAAAGTVSVSFEYGAEQLDNAMAWSAADFLMVNGTNVFPYPEGRPLDFSAEVVVRTAPDWRVATGMTAVRPGTYTASNYHDLVDMPLFVGSMDLDSAMVEGKWHRLATYPAGALTGAARSTLWDHIRAMTPPMSAVFGETPFETYSTLLILTPEYPGGSALEHQNSHVGIYHPGFVGQVVLPSITAHEIFHAWNVKRLRPAEMVPYDYARPQPTTLLWVSEGITDYYADLALVRGGIMSEQEFYDATATKIQNVAETVPVALEDASLTTWIGPRDGSGYVYYPKGSLAGLLLDVLIRDASDNAASLDTVLRELYHTTFKRNRGFAVEEFWQAVTRAARGRSFAEFADRYVDGREPFPYAETLALAGIRFLADSTRVPRLGINTVDDTTGVRVTNVAPEGAGAQAGLRAGDLLLRVGDVRVAGNEFGQEFRARYGSAREGAPLSIMVRRGAETVTLTGQLRFDTVVTYGLTADPAASAKARTIRAAMLSGR
ncbi:MAG TPA: PDZ domain-containing protein [Gemmatimonadales bacterium]|nr:PDZ domain-containing protein [Gemmatimonadales bacterium]